MTHLTYRKRGKIRWAKLLRFSRFSRVPRKFFREYLFKLRIMPLFMCFKRKAPQKFSREKLHREESVKV